MEVLKQYLKILVVSAITVTILGFAFIGFVNWYFTVIG